MDDLTKVLAEIEDARDEVEAVEKQLRDARHHLGDLRTDAKELRDELFRVAPELTVGWQQVPAVSDERNVAGVLG